MKVNLEDLEAAHSLRQRINSVSLKDIEWLRDGVPVETDAKQIEDWKFVGLTNTCFAEMNLLDIPED